MNNLPKSKGLKELLSDKKFCKKFKPLTLKRLKYYMLTNKPRPKENKPIYPVMEIPVTEFIEPNPKQRKSFLKRPFKVKKKPRDSNFLMEQVVI